MYVASPVALVLESSSRAPEPAAETPPRTFDGVYQEYAPFVWRAACRLGVAPSAAEDVVQDTFLVVHRRLGEFEERSSIRAWLFAILVRVVRDHRRAARRRGFGRSVEVDPDGVADPSTPSPLDATERNEAVRELYAILNAMADARREVFVLVELEGLTVPEVSQALGANVNTVYFRLRSARAEFEKALSRRRAKNARRLR
jgi:RNA polymerase sigma-70 factor (ECF subfamily)